MRLRFLYQPVKDVAQAAAFYRDELGLQEAWREGEAVAFTLPGSNISLMLDQDPDEATGGPFFVVEDVVDFYERNRDRLSFLGAPTPIGPGMYVRFTDPSGNVIRVMDDTTSRERA